MTIRRTPEFNDDFKKKLNEKEKRQLSKALGFILDNPRHPSLNIKKTKGRLLKGFDNVFEGRINKNHRFLFLIEDDTYVLLRCGKHSDIFR